MKTMAFVTALLLAMAICQPAAAISGSLGEPAGSIAITLIVVAMLISIGSGLTVCLYRSDVFPCFQRTVGA